ncbi:hypothetical protein HC695_003634 [Salmonella enterica]|nr:hypothetical protein [Salmonella enterica]
MLRIVITPGDCFVRDDKGETMDVTISFTIVKLRFRSRQAALTRFLSCARFLEEGPLTRGPGFEDLKTLFLTWSEYCEKWGLDGREISAISMDAGDGRDGEGQLPDRRCLVHFLWTPAQAFSVREAVNTIAGAAAVR